MPENEALRLAALHDLDILDTESEPGFDAIAALAASTLRTPYAAISLSDRDRLWFKARVGTPMTEMDRASSCCGHAMLQREPLPISDLSLDPRFRDHEFVKSAPALRAYAGAPMWTTDGYCIGVVSVSDVKPREWTAQELSLLQQLAKIALCQIDLRRDAADAKAHAEKLAVLAAREVRHQLVVESMTEGVCVIDNAGDIVSANAAAARILGLPLDELLGCNHRDTRWKTVREDGCELADGEHPAARALVTGQRQSDVVMGIQVPGMGTRWICINAAPVVDPVDDVPKHVVVTFEDITQRRADKERIKANEERLELALKIANAASWDIDLEGDRFHTSRTGTALFGRDAPPEIPRDFWTLVHEEDRERAQAAWEESLAKGVPMEIDHRIVRADGEVRWVHAFAAAKLDARGRLVRASGLLMDVTARKMQEIRLAEALEAAESANHAKQAFLANMSHELRTPLNGIMSAAGALSQIVHTDEKRELTAIMVDSARLLERIVSDVLDYSKIEAGKLDISSAPFNLTVDLCPTVQAAQLAAEAKGLAFTCTVNPRARGIYDGDLLRVKQILHNLLSNAVKFTDAGSIELRVDAVLAPDGVTHVGFEVQDTGIGFDAEAADRLFQRFEQADPDITRRFGGTGLGLAISRSLALLMGGELTAVSTPGRGSTFRFRLPVKLVAEAPPPKAERREPVVFAGPWSLDGDAPFRVLLAEDNAVNQRVVALILESFGVTVTVANDGLQALEALSSAHFDLVLMDLQMPVVDGLTATRRIREREAREGRPRTPIAILSANAMAHHLEESRAAGADRHIAKPFTPQSLVDGMRETMAAAVGWTEGAALSGAA